MHDILVAKALDAIERIFTDGSVSMESTLESMWRLEEKCTDFCLMLEKDIKDMEES